TMTGSAVAAGALAMLLFGGFVSYIFAGLETNNVQRIGHLTVFRDGYFLLGSGNPAAYGIDKYQDVMNLIEHDSVVGPMIQVITPTQSLVGIAGNFSGDIEASKTFLGVGLIPSDRERMRQWDEFGAGRQYAPDSRLSDGDPSRGPGAGRPTSSASPSAVASRKASRNSTTTTSRCILRWRSNSSMAAASTK